MIVEALMGCLYISPVLGAFGLLAGIADAMGW